MRWALLLLTLAAGPARAGLHYSGDVYDDLPSRWAGFLLDQRRLRQAAVPPAKAAPAGLRARYEKEADRLAKKAKLDPDEAADLGALLVRLGRPDKAVTVLRAALEAEPLHFRLAANLGTAWQLAGDLTQAQAALEQAVALAPGRHDRAERLHLRLVRLRAAGKAGLDDLFGVRYVGESGRFEPGSLAAAEAKRLPAAALALAQQLALWLPHDARLLWQLAELANAHGDLATANALFDGCVTEFGLRDDELMARRRAVRAARPRDVAKKDHDAHALAFRPRSSRPLAETIDPADLPPIDKGKANALAWEVVGKTTVGRDGRPSFPKYLRELDGLKVTLRGHLQPLSDGGAGAYLLIEHPVGCWWCEMPEMANLVLVELPEGKTARYVRDRVAVTGRLKLNADDPEKFLYLVRDAEVVAD